MILAQEGPRPDPVPLVAVPLVVAAGFFALPTRAGIDSFDLLIPLTLAALALCVGVAIALLRHASEDSP